MALPSISIEGQNKYTVHSLCLLTTPLLLTFQGKAGFVFPDITLCPTTRFEGVKIVRCLRNSQAQYCDSLKTLLNRNSQQWSDTFNVSRKEFQFNDLSRLSLRDAFFNNENSTNFKRVSDHIIKCKFRGRSCSFLNFKLYLHPTKFWCFTFIPPNRTLGAPGVESGLELILYAGHDFKFQTSDEEFRFVRGYEVAIHAPGTRPDLTSRKLKAQTGSVTSVKLHNTKIVQLDRPSARCLEKAENRSISVVDTTSNTTYNTSYKYTVADCKLYDEQRRYIQQCGCYNDKESLPQKLYYRGLRGCHQVAGSDLLSQQATCEPLLLVSSPRIFSSYLLLVSSYSYYE